jgi:tetratricopeptide (TPR) repeat protein
MARIVLRAGKVAARVPLSIMILGLILYSAKIHKPAKADEAPVIDPQIPELMQTAQDYQANEQYDEAVQVYNDIIAGYPGTDEAMYAQREIVVCRIEQKDFTEAHGALEQFWAQYSTDEKFVEYVKHIKDLYWNAGQYPAHFDLCERIVEEFPQHPLSLDILVDEIAGYIHVKNMPKAAEKVDQLWTQYSTDERFVERLILLKDFYWNTGCYTEHFELCDRIIEGLADHPLRPKVMTDEITGYIHLQDMAKTAEKVEQFRAQYSTDERFVGYVKQIVDKYLQVGKHNEAVKLCHYILTQYSAHNGSPQVLIEKGETCLLCGEPQKALESFQYAQGHLSGTEDEMWLKAGIIRANICLEDDPNDKLINELLTNFSEHPQLSEAILGIAGQYYKEAFTRENSGLTEQSKEFLQKSISLYENSLEDLAGSELAHLEPQIRIPLAESYCRLGQYQKAISCYSQIVTGWPDYEYAWHAQYQIGKSYKRLADKGTISESQANIQVRAAYEQLLAGYPNCPVSGTIQKWLVSHPVE